MSATLVKKLAEVMAAVERVPKRGRNDFHKYDYATEADIVATVRAELSKRHIMLIPSAQSITRDPVGEKGSVLTTIAMEFTFIDGETGDTLTRPWFGCGTDKEDKGLYKAMTGGEKYFLLKTFLMPTGDDPEQDENPRRKASPETVVDARTGEDVPASSLPPAPAGYFYLTDYRINGEWHEAVALRYDAQGGSLKVSTKRQQLGALLGQIVRDGLPAKLDVTMKKNGRGEAYLNNISAYHAERPAPDLSAEPINASDIPFMWLG
jgi:hypothetical protein